MRAATLFCLLAFTCLVLAQLQYPRDNDSPIWKVFCDSQAIFRGRVDSIVNPGTFSTHVHKVFGGSNFSPTRPERTPLQNYAITKGASCTTCSIKTVDNTNYWTPDLYYRWDNGTYSLVPNSGLTVYYLSRAGSTGANRTNPNWQPIPNGLRMLAGDPARRVWNNKDVKHNAVSYVCLNYNGGGFQESSDWSPLSTYKCPQGIRAQIWFPMCWDGVNLDSSDHKSHMSYPINGNYKPDGGDCPNTHPVRIPGVFFEHLYSTDGFPHGDGKNRFLWSMGDPTGFGFHGDFVSGWDPEVMRQAIKDPKCSNSNKDMAFGNNVKACPPLAPYVKDGSEPKCTINKKVPLTESLGSGRPINRMPGCYNNMGLIQGCDVSPKGSDNSGSLHIVAASVSGYLTVAGASGAVTATASSNFLTYSEVWSYQTATNGSVFLLNTQYNNVISAQDQARLVGSKSTWEMWTVVPINGNTTVAFRSSRTNQYLSLQSDKSLQFNAKSITATETFKVMPVNGGFIPTDDGLGGYIQ